MNIKIVEKYTAFLLEIPREKAVPSKYW